MKETHSNAIEPFISKGEACVFPTISANGNSTVTIAIPKLGAILSSTNTSLRSARNCDGP